MQETFGSDMGKWMCARKRMQGYHSVHNKMAAVQLPMQAWQEAADFVRCGCSICTGNVRGAQLCTGQPGEYTWTFRFFSHITAGVLISWGSVSCTVHGRQVQPRCCAQHVPAHASYAAADHGVQHTRNVQGLSGGVIETHMVNGIYGIW